LEAGSRHAETRGGFTAIHYSSRYSEVSCKKSVDDLVVLLKKPVPPRLGAGVFLRVHVDDFVARNAGQAHASYCQYAQFVSRAHTAWCGTHRAYPGRSRWLMCPATAARIHSCAWVGLSAIRAATCLIRTPAHDALRINGHEQSKCMPPLRVPVPSSPAG